MLIIIDLKFFLCKNIKNTNISCKIHIMKQLYKLPLLLITVVSFFASICFAEQPTNNDINKTNSNEINSKYFQSNHYVNKILRIFQNSTFNNFLSILTNVAKITSEKNDNNIFLQFNTQKNSLIEVIEPLNFGKPFLTIYTFAKEDSLTQNIPHMFFSIFNYIKIKDRNFIFPFFLFKNNVGLSNNYFDCLIPNEPMSIDFLIEKSNLYPYAMKANFSSKTQQMSIEMIFFVQHNPHDSKEKFDQVTKQTSVQIHVGNVVKVFANELGQITKIYKYKHVEKFVEKNGRKRKLLVHPLIHNTKLSNQWMNFFLRECAPGNILPAWVEKLSHFTIEGDDYIYYIFVVMRPHLFSSCEKNRNYFMLSICKVTKNGIILSSINTNKCCNSIINQKIGKL